MLAPPSATSSRGVGSVSGTQAPASNRHLWVVEFNGSIHALAKIVVGLRTTASSRRRGRSRAGGRDRTFYLHEWFAVETLSLWWQEAKRRERLARSEDGAAPGVTP